MTVPEDWPAQAIADYIRIHHSGADNPGREYVICEALGISDRRFREWLEGAFERYPLATSSDGIWWCENYADFTESLTWRHKRLKAEARAMSRQKKCRDKHYPQPQLQLWEVA